MTIPPVQKGIDHDAEAREDYLAIKEFTHEKKHCSTSYMINIVLNALISWSLK